MDGCCDVATLRCSAVAIEVSIADVPFFSEDIEASGRPATITALKDGVSDADALIIFTPEYNRSVPGVTENAVDWLSRRFMAGSRAQLADGALGGWVERFVGSVDGQDGTAGN
ncbi:MAG: NAD(P)H-dependent FMN reductase [Candidatus Aldehydirespiratoraceae bacterium]